MTTMTPTPVRFETPTGYKDEIAARSDAVRWLRIPARRYLVIDGTEAPGTPEFKDAIGTLYPVAYTLHFALKARRVDAPVGALQGLYRLGGQPVTSIDEARDAPFVTGGWLWRLMLPIPEAAATEEIEAAIRDVRAKKQPPRIGELWAFTWEEGLVAQITHIGAYGDEPRTIARLQQAVTDAGLTARGVHHEIYISDPNRARPDRLKTLLRLDVAERP